MRCWSSWGSSAAPESFVVAPDPFGEARGDGVAVDRDEGIGRLAAADLLGDSLGEFADRVGDQFLELIGVERRGVAAGLVAGASGSIADAGGLGSEVGIDEQFLDVAEAVGPLAEAGSGDRVDLLAPIRPTPVAAATPPARLPPPWFGPPAWGWAFSSAGANPSIIRLRSPA